MASVRGSVLFHLGWRLGGQMNRPLAVNNDLSLTPGS